MLIVYLSNEDNFIQSHDAPPLIGETCSLGAIASLEFYKGELETVCLALTEPKTYADSSHTFDIQLTPDRSIIKYGWSMIGRAPTGRLMNYEPTSHETLMRPVPSDWCVDRVDTCKPLETGTYKAVHICHCVKVDQPVAVLGLPIQKSDRCVH